MTFDGPGRSSECAAVACCLRPDWEAVLTPVADAMAARADVDAARMAVVGLGDAGYGVLRALREHRFAAAVADPGIADASTPWMQLLPDAARAQLLREAPAAFDREIHLAGLFAPELHGLIEREGPWYGQVGTSPYALYRRVLGFRLGDAELEPDRDAAAAVRARAGAPLARAGRVAADAARRPRGAAALPRGRLDRRRVAAWLGRALAGARTWRARK